MRHLSIVEASRYSNALLPLKSDIYRNGSSTYSNFKNLLLNKEISIPSISKLSSEKCGILPEIQAIWYVVPSNLEFNLHIYRYDLNALEVLSNFSSCIQFVKIFKPIKGIFSNKISHCLLVVTESDVIVYGIESETHSIINTDFSAKLYSKVTCIETIKGGIFFGCADGCVYQAIYRSIDILNYKYLNLYTPSNILKSLVNVFKKKKQKIADISVGEKYLVSLSKDVEIFNVEGGIYKLSTISLETHHSYTNIQIVEENPLFFYCTTQNGVRDYFTTEKMFSLDPPTIGSTESEKLVLSNFTKFLSIRKTYERSTIFLSSFNDDQLRNFSKTKPIENFEVVSIYQPVLSADLTEKNLYILTENKISHYLILDSKKFLLNCRPQEIYLMFKNYGEVDFMVKYYDLLTHNEDVTKLEGLCKNESIKNHALFVWIYQLISPVWNTNISSLKDGNNTSDSTNTELQNLDSIVKKLKVLKSKVMFINRTANDFIEEFIQTNFYTTLLMDYNISFNETFESILTSDTTFKKDTLKALLDVFTLNQSIEPLLKTMQNYCPLFLPLEQINLQRGLQLIKKDDRESLMRSLDYLSQTPYEANIITRFNELGFYYGSMFLIKEKFDFDYETAVKLFKESVKCKKALDLGLSDSRESVLYPLFESLICLEDFSPCICCDYKENMIDLIKIENPLFKIFLKDNQGKSEKIYNLYWKYLLFRNQKIEAIEAILNITQRTDISLEKKVDLLHTALSVSAGTHLNAEIKLRLKLYDIQKELVLREPSLKTSQLLDADTLFNDYCISHVDLKIKVLDSINFKDEKVLRELYSKYFEKRSLRDCFIFLKDINNKSIKMVVELLVKKVDANSDDICNGLSLAGFEYEEIIQCIQEILNGSIHPDVKVELMKCLRRFSKFGEFKDCETQMEKNFGIKIYK